MSDVLTEICDRKREHIKERKRLMPEATLLKRLDNAPVTPATLKRKSHESTPD